MTEVEKKELLNAFNYLLEHDENHTVFETIEIIHGLPLSPTLSRKKWSITIKQLD